MCAFSAAGNVQLLLTTGTASSAPRLVRDVTIAGLAFAYALWTVAAPATRWCFGASCSSRRADDPGTMERDVPRRAADRVTRRPQRDPTAPSPEPPGRTPLAPPVHRR